MVKGNAVPLSLSGKVDVNVDVDFDVVDLSCWFKLSMMMMKEICDVDVDVVGLSC